MDQSPIWDAGKKRAAHSPKTWEGAALNTAKGFLPATAAIAIAAAEPAAIFTRGHGLCFVHGHGAPIIIGAVKLADGILSFRFGRHFDKAETLAATRVAIDDNFGRFDRSALREGIAQDLIGC